MITEISRQHKRPSKAVALKPGIRREKVLGIRKQLAGGTFDFERRLDGLVDKIIRALGSNTDEHQ